MINYALEIVLFTCGATVMIYELVGTRVLAPYLGTSLIVWTSLIGIILGSLGVGYWYGGKSSDRMTDDKTLAHIIFVAGMFIGMTTYIYYDLIFMVDSLLPNLIMKSMISSFLIFAAPSVLLGMVTPYAIRLRTTDINNLGKTVGSFSAISTTGSIVGTFIAGYFLIPRFGTNNILVILSVLLVMSALACLQRNQIKYRIALVSIYALLMSLGYYLHAKYNVKDYIVDADTPYSRVQICDVHVGSLVKGSIRTDQKMRLMKINNSCSTAISLSTPDLQMEYTKYFRLAEYFRPHFKKALMLGGTGYAFPMYYLSNYPESTLDVVEIDSMITELAKKYFNLQTNTRLTIIHEDGRTYINKTRETYDVLFNDAYSSYFSIPYQLTTKESIRRMYDILTERGVAMVNIISAIDGEQGEFLRAVYLTFQSIFPRVYLFPVQNATDGTTVQNIMLVALKSEGNQLFTTIDHELNHYLQHRWKQKIIADVPVLTDDFAPVDYYISEMIVGERKIL